MSARGAHAIERNARGANRRADFRLDAVGRSLQAGKDPLLDRRRRSEVDDDARSGRRGLTLAPNAETDDGREAESKENETDPRHVSYSSWSSPAASDQ